jgi:hypothetical protein
MYSDVSCDTALKGRYLWIQKPGAGSILSLAEVQVSGYNCDIDANKQHELHESFAAYDGVIRLLVQVRFISLCMHMHRERFYVYLHERFVVVSLNTHSNVI